MRAKQLGGLRHAACPAERRQPHRRMVSKNVSPIALARRRDDPAGGAIVPGGRIDAHDHAIKSRWRRAANAPEILRAPERAVAIERLELGLPADLHPVFGEVWALVARGNPPQQR